MRALSTLPVVLLALLGSSGAAYAQRREGQGTRESTNLTNSTHPEGHAETVGEKPPDPLRFLLWHQPVPTIVFATSGAFALSLGVAVPLIGRIGLTAETEIVVGSRGILNGRGTVTEQNVAGFYGALGAMIMVLQTGVTGLLIQPKFVGAYRDVTDNGVHTAEGEFGMGLDLGYQLGDRHLMVAAFFGAHVSYCWNCPFSSTTTNPDGTMTTVVQRGDFFQPGINLNLLRLGLVF